MSGRIGTLAKVAQREANLLALNCAGHCTEDLAQAAMVRLLGQVAGLTADSRLRDEIEHVVYTAFWGRLYQLQPDIH